MLTIIARAQLPKDGMQAADRDHELQERLYLGLLERGILVAVRGMVNLGIRHTDDHLVHFLSALNVTCEVLADT